MKIVHQFQSPQNPVRLAVLVSACLEAIQQKRAGEMVYIRPKTLALPVDIGME